MFKKVLWNSMANIAGNSYNKNYSEFNRLDSKEKLLNFQEDHLNVLLSHSYKNVPYYSNILKKYKNIDLSNFKDIPLINKNIIRKNAKNLISKDIKRRNYYFNSSGGSTGEPLKFIQDDLYLKWRSAANYYYYKNILKIDEPYVKKIILWGSERDIWENKMSVKEKFFNWTTNTVFLNTFKVREADMEKHIKCINTYKPDIIRGYAGSLYELTKYAEKKDLILYKPKIIVSSAETLRPEMRNKIEEVFGTKVYNFYGSREVGGLAGECKNGLMHSFSFGNYIEVLDKNDNPVKEGEEGRIVVTNLFNYSMPFIRYEIGDLGILGPENCNCGNILPTLKKITGRMSDSFLKEDGTVVNGGYFAVQFYFKDWVKSYQVIQEDYNFIKILVVLNSELNFSEKMEIENKFKKVMGQDCHIKWEIVDEIPTTNNGKYINTKSHVWE